MTEAAPAAPRESDGKIYIGFGSNIGDRVENLRRALGALEAGGEVAVTATSSLYLTEPVGYNDQRDFINGVVETVSALTPRGLLHSLEALERELGRRRGPRLGPRIIDLDILLWGERVIDTPELVVPHPRMHERRFVLVPLAEIAPRVRHPVLGLTAAAMLAALSDDRKVALLGKWKG